jgi:hypothetical protein
VDWKFSNNWHVSLAAEAVTAALFAHCGYDVSVQYGPNQPEYDLMVAKGEQMFKVSVKGSQDGSWGLCQGQMTRGSADYHSAIDRWVRRHKPRTVLCLVQFKKASLSRMPRVYLATAGEIGKRLHDTANGRGDTILYEHHKWGPRARGAGTTEKVPKAWRLSPKRLDALAKAVA